MEQPAILDHLVHFCVVAALLKGPFGPKIQSLKIDNCDALHETSFALKIRKNVIFTVYTKMVSLSTETIYPLIDRPQCQI